MGDVRIDKFIWAVRLFKTRSLAADAIKRGRITINGAQVKSAHVVKVGDVVAVRLGPGTRSFEVLQLAQNRMGAKLVPLHLKEVTPPDQLEALELARLAASMNRRKGLGRPTKKERRDIDEFFAPEDSEFDFDDLDLDFDEEDGDEL
ncbi:MAG: RNA-binding S4 domain-containing protein [Marinilabiliaceae bacterium]|nr:RNA-binding S4 domain-containing protein [Marinilabiliaceae bacterium]